MAPFAGIPVSMAMILFAAGGLLAAGAEGALGQPDPAISLTSLVQAERSFARASEAEGIRQAFLTWLAPDAIVFRPGPVEARPIYEKMDPADPARLTWEPEVAEIASSGELGYTSGPYQVSRGPGAEPTDFGHYVSIWKKMPDGAWRVILDIGIPHGRPASPNVVEFVARPCAQGGGQSLSPEELRQEERAFGARAGAFDNEAGKKGLRKALAAAATENIRVLRPGHFPAVGMLAAGRLIPDGPGRGVRGSQRMTAGYRVGMSWSGDLAYSYGTITRGKEGAGREATAYLRIWRRETPGVWKISLDIELPVSPS